MPIHDRARAGGRLRGLGGFGLVVGLLLGACQQVSEPVAPADVERARAALVPFKEQLVDALTGALQEGSPESAIAVCRERAPQIAAELSVAGVRMGRTSHKTRNPANDPEPWIEPLLAAYLEDPENTRPRAVRIGESTFGYVEPIYVMHFCLSCHGPSVEPALLETIRSLYPQDRATGFRANELRGLFWVTMPLGQPPTPT
jgi:hypothetical protein